MIRFTNPQEIDIRLITTLGVNVKDNDSAIGYFGTGLKYALAVLLREQQEITICSGETCLTFFTEKETIRGKEFNFISMHTSNPADGALRLGFTTELGKNWTLQNAYRELHCNCTDEGGIGGEEYPVLPQPTAELTQISVSGSDFEEIHRNREDFLLSPTREPLYTSESLDIYAGRTRTVFYKGVAVRQTHEDAAHTYNIKTTVDLTEDRTAKDTNQIDRIIASALGQCPMNPIITDALCNKEGYEHNFHAYEFGSPTEGFYNMLQNLIETRPLEISDHCKELFVRKRGTELSYTRYVLTEAEEHIYARAADFCKSIGFDVYSYKVRFVESLGARIIGRADKEKNTILLARKAFDDDMLEKTLIEEFIHLQYGVGDYTRSMQDRLFSEIVRIGKGRGVTREQ